MSKKSLVPLIALVKAAQRIIDRRYQRNDFGRHVLQRQPRPASVDFDFLGLRSSAIEAGKGCGQITTGVATSVASVITTTMGRTRPKNSVKAAWPIRRQDTAPPCPVKIWMLPAGVSIHFMRAVGRIPSRMFQPSRAWPIPSRASPIPAYSSGTLPCETQCPSRSLIRNQKLGACARCLASTGVSGTEMSPLLSRTTASRSASIVRVRTPMK